MNEDHPFLQADISSELQGLIDKTIGSQEKCMMEEYVNGDNDLAVVWMFMERTGRKTLVK